MNARPDHFDRLSERQDQLSAQFDEFIRILRELDAAERASFEAHRDMLSGLSEHIQEAM